MRIEWRLPLILLLLLPAQADLASLARASEEADREVDEAALVSQREAAQELRGLLKKFAGRPQEAALLFRLAEIQQQSASMEFRVGHGKAGKSDLTSYRRMMRESISPLTKLIQRYPSFEEIGRVWFLRGKAYEETGKTQAAKSDYLYLTRRFPGIPEVVPAYMSLAEFYIRANRHREAIAYLRNVEKRPDSTYYPHALYKMAWSHHLLGEVDAALKQARKVVVHYRTNSSGSADRALRETVLQDVPTFYFQGFERNPKAYSNEQALQFFRSLEDGPALGGMTVRYATLLRAHDHQNELRDWELLVLSQEKKRPDTLELVLTVYEYQLNKKLYGALVETSGRLAEQARNQQDSEGAKKAEKLLLETASQLQKRMIAYQGSAKSDEAAVQLAGIYESFARMVPSDDPRLRMIRANLAETHFAIRQYDRAAQNYRWIVGQGSWSENARTPKFETGGITVPEASLKAIASRYESLRAGGLIPRELQAVSLKHASKKGADPRITEWIKWIDQHVSETNQGIDNFQFEANRALYANGQLQDAVDRLVEFTERYPRSSFAVPSATLVLDTLIASRQWDDVEEMANRFASNQAWKGTAFGKRLAKVAADAKFKQAETAVASKDPEKALEHAVEFTEQYSSSAMKTDAFAIASNSALAMKDRDLSVKYLGSIVSSAPASESAAKALLAMGKLEEERYSFAKAAEYYATYLLQPARSTRDTTTAQKESLRKRVLVYGWLGGSPEQLGGILSHREICTPAHRAECSRLRALRFLMDVEINRPILKQALAKAEKGPREERAIWATVALEKTENLSHSERDRMIRSLARNWKSLDSLTRFSLLTRISRSVPRSFKIEGERLARLSPITSSERSIVKRMRLLKEMEDLGIVAADLPWSRIRSGVLAEVAAGYSDLIDGIRAIPVRGRATASQKQQHARMIAELVRPFEQKARGILGEASRLHDSNKSSLSLEMMDEVDTQAEWKPVQDNRASRAELIRAKWAEAIREGRWSQVGFFMKESEASRLMPSDVAAVAKAVSLAAAGAGAEANLALADTCRSGRSTGRIHAACASVSGVLVGRR